MAVSNQLELLCRLTHAASLQQICDLTYEITGNPIFVSDMAHTILAYTRSAVITDPTWQENVVDAHLERNTLRQDREVGSIYVSSTNQQRPVLVEDDFLPYQRLIKTLVHEGRAVGVVVLTAYLQPFREEDVDLLEIISAFLLPCLMRERYAISSNADLRSVENYFIRLLENPACNRSEVNRRLTLLGYQSADYTYVLTFCTADGTGDRTEALEEIRQDIADTLASHTFLYNTMLVCIYGCDHPIATWPGQVPGLEALLKKQSLLVGVSRQLEHPTQLRDGYLQAQAGLDKGRRLGRVVPCYPFDSMAFFLMLDHLPQAELEQYCHPSIEMLWHYDQAHNTELCSTLQVYLEQAKSLSRTAEILFIHRNTVRYRINRCIELMQDSLEDGNVIFAYIFSLRILEYNRKHVRGFPGLPLSSNDSKDPPSR